MTHDTASATDDGMTVEFDLHGIVGVRVIGARAPEIAGIRGQLGPIEATLDREPDLVIRFADDGPWSASALRYVEPREAAFNDESFVLLRGRRQQPTMVAIPFDAIGNRCEIVCRRGTIGIPLLLQIVNMIALGRGVLPLHASAFVYRGRCVLVTGWAKGGKSETLLAFAEEGASYLGDEWIYLNPQTGTASGIPEPMRLWAWHVRAGSRYQRHLSASQRVRLRAMEAGIGVAERALHASRGRRRVASLLERALPVIRRQASVQLPPATVFGEATAVRGPTKVDHLVLAMSHASPDVECLPIEASEVADRMTASLQYERRDFLASYLQYRYAFPSRRSPTIDNAVEIERGMLDRVLGDLPTVALRHPYPVRFERLFTALAPYLDT